MAKLTDSAPQYSFRPMQPGETRLIERRSQTGELINSYTIHRTDRPYVYDQCDAYNENMSEKDRARGVQWRVLPTGELKLEYSDESIRRNGEEAERRREAERQEYIRRLRYPVTAWHPQERSNETG